MIHISCWAAEVHNLLSISDAVPRTTLWHVAQAVHLSLKTVMALQGFALSGSTKG